MYSNKRDVLERLRATLLGLEKAKAVPTDDWLSAPAPVSKSEVKVRGFKTWTIFWICHFFLGYQIFGGSLGLTK